MFEGCRRWRLGRHTRRRHGRPGAMCGSPTWTASRRRPRIVRNARKLDTVTFEECRDGLRRQVLMLRRGRSPPMYSGCVGRRTRVDRRRRHRITIKDVPGRPSDQVAHDRSEAKVTIVGLPDIPRYAAKIRAVTTAPTSASTWCCRTSQVEDGQDRHHLHLLPRHRAAAVGKTGLLK